jgi:uncharacterized protein YkwD
MQLAPGKRFPGLMKLISTIFLICTSLVLLAQNSYTRYTSVSPLSSYSTAWNDIKYSKCNTAAGEAYMSNAEKETVYILNLVRSNPALFAKTVLKKYPSVSGNLYLATDSFYFISLVNRLMQMKPLDILYPDKACFESAACHATSSGIAGYAGHKRINRECEKKKNYNGECCDYGHKDPLEIILSLLIDEGVPSLGHRNIFLSAYNKIGVSIQPHKKYGYNAVFDFAY